MAQTSEIVYRGDLVWKRQTSYLEHDLIHNEARWLEKIAAHDSRGHFPRLKRLNVRRRWLEMTWCGEHITAATVPHDWREQCREILKSLRSAQCSHRDIRPGNLLVSNGVIKLIDFGWSCPAGSEDKSPHDPGLGEKWRIGGKFDDALSLEASMMSIMSARPHRAPRAAALTRIFVPKSVLFVVQAMFETVYDHVARFLEDRGCDVEMLIVADATERESHPDCPDSTIFADRRFVRRCQNRYDVIVLCIHCRKSQRMNRFQKRVTPRLGYVFLEHDLLAPEPERGIRRKTLGVVSFQEKHRQALRQAGYRTVMAKWNKLDADYPEYAMAGASPWEDAVLIGSSHPLMSRRMAKSVEFEHPGVFRTVWYKPWNTSDREVKKGTVRLPSIFESPRGGKYCADIAKFHLSCGSSSLLDALLFGCMPVLYLPPAGGALVSGLGRTIEFSETAVDEIVSRVNFGAFNPGYAVTSTELARKVEMLRRDRALFDSTLDRLKAEWFPDDYASLPSTGEAVWTLMGEALR